jgi:hypothetical protein
MDSKASENLKAYGAAMLCERFTRLKRQLLLAYYSVSTDWHTCFINSLSCDSNAACWSALTSLNTAIQSLLRTDSFYS